MSEKNEYVEAIPVSLVKGIIQLTDILDKYINAKIQIWPAILEKTNNTSVFKIINDGSEEFVLKLVDTKSEHKVKQLKVEFEKIRDLGDFHPHFIKGIDIKEYRAHDSTRIEMLMEYGGKDLQSLMNEATIDDITIWMIQSISAFLFSVHYRISHSDIKPVNIVCKNKFIKVIDLGCVIQYGDEFEAYVQLGVAEKPILGYTAAYASPEILREVEKPSTVRNFKGINGLASDIYSWGVTFYQLYTKKTKETLFNLRKNHGKINENEYHEFLDKVKFEMRSNRVESKIIDTILKCLEFDPKKRTTFDNIYFSLKYMEDNVYSDQSTAIKIYLQIAKSYFKACKNEKLSRIYYKKAEELNQSTNKMDFEVVIEVCIAQAKIHLWSNHFTESMSLYAQALLISREKFGLNHYITAKCLEKMYHAASNICFRKNISSKSAHNYEKDIIKCIQLMNKTLEIREKIFGKNHKSTACCYYDIGNALHKINNPDQAKQYFTKFASIVENLPEKGNEKLLASLFRKVGLAYKLLKNNCEAYNYLIRSSELAKVYKTKSDEVLEKNYTDMAYIYLEMSKHEIALFYSIKASNVKTKDKEGLKTSLDKISLPILIFEQSGNHNEAKILLDIFLNDFETHFRKESLQMMYYSLDLEIDGNKSKQRDEVIRIYNAINYLYNTKYRVENCYCYYFIGKIQDDEGNIDLALENYLKSVELLKTIPTNESANEIVGMLYLHVGYSFDRLSQYGKSRPYYFKALHIFMEIYGELHYYTAITLEKIGLTYHWSNEYSIAINYLIKSVSIKYKLFENNSVDISIMFNNISMFYCYLGQNYIAHFFILKSINLINEKCDLQNSEVNKTLRTAIEIAEHLKKLMQQQSLI